MYVSSMRQVYFSLYVIFVPGWQVISRHGRSRFVTAQFVLIWHEESNNGDDRNVVAKEDRKPC